MQIPTPPNPFDRNPFHTRMQTYVVLPPRPHHRRRSKRSLNQTNPTLTKPHSTTTTTTTTKQYNSNEATTDNVQTFHVPCTFLPLSILPSSRPTDRPTDRACNTPLPHSHSPSHHHQTKKRRGRAKKKKNHHLPPTGLKGRTESRTCCCNPLTCAGVCPILCPPWPSCPCPLSPPCP